MCPAVKAVLLITPSTHHTHTNTLTDTSLHFADQSYRTVNAIYYLSSFLTGTKYNEQLSISLGYGNGMQSGTMEKRTSSLPNLRITQTKAQSLEC